MRSTCRPLSVALTLLLLWTGPAGAVVVPGHAVDSTGKSVANAQFAAVIDNGELSHLDVRKDPSGKGYSWSHPKQGFTIEARYENATQLSPPAMTPDRAAQIYTQLREVWQRTSGFALDRVEPSAQLDEWRTSGLDAARWAATGQWGWAVKAGMNLSYDRGDSQGSLLTGNADASGRFQVNTDDLLQLGNAPYNAGDTLRFMAGLKAEGAVQYYQNSATWTGLFQYLEPCKTCCWMIDGHLHAEPEAVSTIQLPPAVIPVQHTSSSSSPAAGGDPMADQWAFKKLGLPLQLPWERLASVTVAVIDSGLDYRHPGFKPANLWVNSDPGFDLSYPDDVMGWNYILGHNNPWDDIGHGTFVAGLILAVNPRVRIMPIKVMDGFGGGLNSDIGAAVIYAVERGARVINLSVGTKGLSKLHQAVVDYARSRGVVLVAAAGNEGESIDAYSPGGIKGVLSVAALDQNDKKPGFGNWGQNVALAAPGVDIVSWRARNSDFVLIASGGKDYKAGDAIVPADRWLYRASGTSFSAPFVAGAAALLFSLNPNLTGRQVERMLVESADDVETPGWDQITGAGRLNIARAALSNPNTALVAKVARFQPGQLAGQPAVQVFGTADGTTIKSYQVQIGRGEAPTSWKTVAVQADKTVEDGLLAAFPLREITARGKWSVRVIVQDAGGRTREARGSLDIN
jgi:subtilisin family serine protease